MIDIFEGAGVFIYPLGVCSVLAVFIFFERIVALRRSQVLPDAIIDQFVKGDILKAKPDKNTVAGRILAFYQKNNPDPDALKALAALETTRLERGIFILEIVVGAAPLIGLLGTVSGLIRVFSGMNPDDGMPDPNLFMEGIALALTTTMLGLTIAIPALVANTYLNRRIEMLTAQINVGVERLMDIAKNNKA